MRENENQRDRTSISAEAQCRYQVAQPTVAFFGKIATTAEDQIRRHCLKPRTGVGSSSELIVIVEASVIHKPVDLTALILFTVNMTIHQRNKKKNINEFFFANLYMCL